MVVGKKKRPVRKATAKAVKTLARKTAKSAARLKRANVSLKKTDFKIKADLSKLKAELDKLKKSPKAKKRELNEYNLFMRRQLRAGKSFKQAVKLWKKYRAGRMPGKTRTITKIKRVIVRQKPKIKRVLVRQKPKVKYVVRTKLVEKPVLIEKQAVEQKTGQAIVLPEKIIHILEQNILKESSQGLPLEEISYRLLSVYFEEMARLGLKRSVSLDELVGIYMHLIKKIEARLGKQQKSLLHEEEVAYRLVKLYVLELARFGKKRTTSLDELLDSYFFVLAKISPVKTA